MTSADLLTENDRCPRNGFWSSQWQRQKLHPNDILRRAVDAGLMSTEEDPGQSAGDEVMTLCADRGLDISGTGLYQIAMHNAALADIVVTLLRSGHRWERPADTTVNTVNWESSVYLDPSGLRLHRVILVDRWSDERKLAERHSWRTAGEIAAYELPMTLHIVLIGQRRDGKHVSPWSKGWLHPKSRGLRIRKSSGEGFGGNWIACWREEQDTISRDHWVEAMKRDGVIPDVLFKVDVQPPCAEIIAKWKRLAEKKLVQIQTTTETPDPCPSQCWWPTPCQFAECCSQYTIPSEKNGFIALSQVSPESRT